MPDRELQAAIMAAGEIKSESRDLRAAIAEFAELLHRGLIRSTVQGMVMIIVGIMLAITFIGVLSQPWSCDATNLSRQQGSVHYKACAVIFPQVVPQVANIKRTAAATKAGDDNRQAVLDERKRTNELLDQVPDRLACVLLIRPQDRTDTNVKTCLAK